VIGAIVEILLHHRFDLPRQIDLVFGILAFTVEGFLFAFHLHSRAPLDIHLHVLLVYAILGCVISCCLEFYKPEQILFTYARILFTMLQGTWFWQAGFILYPPTDDELFRWDRCSHEQVMTATMSFCWHALLIAAALLVQLITVGWLYRSVTRLADQWDELIYIDEERSRSAKHLYTTCKMMGNNSDESETRFLRVNSDDEDEFSLDEKIEFDKTAKLLNEEMGAETGRKENGAGSSSSSTTSGNFSNGSYMNEVNSKM
jgi:hypothetical protein